MSSANPKSLISALADYTVIDLETTGLDASHDDIIELGALRVRDGQVVARFDQLVNPGYKVDPFILELTGIQQADLDAAPPLDAVLGDYMAFIGEDTIVGHHVTFDIHFLSAAAGEFDPFFVDTMRLSRLKYRDLKHHRLADMVEALNLQHQSTHRAEDDIQATNDLYQTIMRDGMPDPPVRVRTYLRLQQTTAADIPEDADPDSPLYGRVCVFTGTLERMSREQARDIVIANGGLFSDNLTKHTNFLIIGDKTLHMTKVKTDSFMPLFNALSIKRATLPARTLRFFKQQFYSYALTNQPNATIRVAGIDDERIGDEELILAIGKPSMLGLCGLRGLTAGEWYRHIVMRDLEFTADEILTNAYPQLFAKSNNLPVHMLLNEAKGDYPKCRDHATRSFDACLNHTIRAKRDSTFIKHRSVDGILRDFPDNRKKAIRTIAYLRESEVDCDQLERFLQHCFITPDYYESLASRERSDFHRLVKIYDWLKYGK